MKNSIYLCLMLCLSAASNAQILPALQFDATDNSIFRNNFWLDSTHANNVWQIGRPQKPLFDSAYNIPASLNSALMTDTLNPYPINDTSIFYFRQIREAYWCARLEFVYKIDTDPTDMGSLEVSTDNGATWMDVIRQGDNSCDFMIDSTFNWCAHRADSSPYYSQIHPRNPFTGYYADNWFSFSLNWCPAEEVDTILYRFTFISDSVQTNKDGWIIDDLDVGEYVYCEFPSGGNIAVKRTEENLFKLNLFPNPADDVIQLNWQNLTAQTFEIQVFNLQGALIQHFQTNQNQYSIPLENWASGTYLYRLRNLDKQEEQSGYFLKK